MELILWGHSTQDSSWNVKETNMAGYCRVYLLETGNLIYKDTYGTVNLINGDIYIFPSHISYEITQTPGSSFRCLWLHLDLYTVILNKLIHIPRNKKLYYHLFDFIQASMDTESLPQYTLQKSCEILIHYCLADRYFLFFSPNIQEIADDISTHFDQELTITDLASRYGYSKEHFIRLFKSEAGLTPYQYFITCRMSKACEFLRLNYKVSETADKIGYKDLKTFERAFKKYYGRTASDYQKNYRNYI